MSDLNTLVVAIRSFKNYPVIFYNFCIHQIFQRILLFLKKKESNFNSCVVDFLNDVAFLNPRLFNTFIDYFEDIEVTNILNTSNFVFYQNLIVLKSKITLEKEFQFLIAIFENATNKNEIKSSLEFQKLLIIYFENSENFLGVFENPENDSISKLTDFLVHNLVNLSEFAVELFIKIIFINFKLFQEIEKHRIFINFVFSNFHKQSFLRNIEILLCFYLTKYNTINFCQNLCTGYHIQNSDSLSLQINFILKTVHKIFALQIERINELSLLSQISAFNLLYDSFCEKENQQIDFSSIFDSKMCLSKFEGFDFQIYDKDETQEILERIKVGEFQTDFSVNLNDVFELICDCCNVSRKFLIYVVYSEDSVQEIRSKTELYEWLRHCIQNSDFDKNMIVVKLLVQLDPFG